MSTNQDHSKRVAKNTGYLFIRMILVLVIGLYTSRLILQNLGIEDFGIYNVVGSVVVLFSFLKTALNNATYRYIAYELGAGSTSKLRKVYSMAINCHVTLSVIFFIILEIIGVWILNGYLNIPEERLSAANWAFQFSILTFCVSIIQTPLNSNIIAHEHMNFYAVVSILEVMLKLGIVYLLIISPVDKLVTYSFLVFAVSLIVFVFYYVYCKRKFNDTKYIRYWDAGILKQFTSYSGWSLTVNITDVTTTQSISIFFNMFLGVVANAALGITNQVLGQVNAFIVNFAQAVNPRIVKSYAEGNYDYFENMIYSTAKLSYLLFLFVSLPVFINIEYVLSVWLGDYPELTSTLVRITIFYFLIDALQQPLWVAAHATGRIKWHQIIVSSVKILTIPAVYMSLKLGYSAGVAISMLVIDNLFVAVARTLYMKKLIRYSIRKYLTTVIFPVFLITIISAPLPLVISKAINDDLISFFVSSLTSVIMLAILIITYGLNRQEKQILLSLGVIRKITNKFKYSK